MKQVVIKNSLLILVFVIINIVLLFVEKHVSESTSELLFFFWIAALITSATILNIASFSNRKGKMVRILLSFTVGIFVLAFSWGVIYFLNWHILYPLVS